MSRRNMVYVAGVALVMIGWIGANPPGAAPDETAHYVRAAASGYFQNTGERFLPLPARATLREKFDHDVNRLVDLPASVTPDGRWACHRLTGSSAACLHGEPTKPPGVGSKESTAVGPYPPALYLVMGLPMRASNDPSLALYVGRGISATLSVGMLAIAWSLSRGRWRRAAVVVAVSPMVVFLASSLTLSGVEITAALANAAAVAAVARGRTDPAVWAMYGASGVVLASSRMLGPLWVVLAMALLPALAGWSQAKRRIMAGGRGGWLAVGATLVASVVTTAWTLLALPRDRASINDAVASVASGIRRLPELGRQEVGVFGWLDTSPPEAFSYVVGVAQLLVVVGALIVASARYRLMVLSLFAFVVAVAVALDVLTQIPIGFRVQARYVMPGLAVLAVLVGETLEGQARSSTTTARRFTQPILFGAPVVVALAQPAAWFLNARQSAVGVTGPRWFVSAAEWSPPAGWWPWFVVVAVGALLAIIGSALPYSRDDGVVALP